MALAAARANVLVSGISSWGISDSTQSDTGYSLIPYPRNGKITISTLAKNNSLGQPTPFGYELSGSVQFPACRTAANFLDLLDSLGSDLIEHKITLVNGQIISSNPGTSAMSPTGFGTKWRFVCDGDMDSDMYIELSISRRLTNAEYTKILTTANAPATGASATFTNILSLTRADIVPAGVTSIGLGAVGGSITDTVSNLRSGKLTAELLTTKDQYGRDFGFAIKIDFSCECLETLQSQLLVWDDIMARANQSTITLVNGLVFTLPSQLGFTTTISIDKDMDDVAVVQIAGSGIIQLSAWEGIVGT